jgi:hypothetical protein
MGPVGRTSQYQAPVTSLPSTSMDTGGNLPTTPLVLTVKHGKKKSVLLDHIFHIHHHTIPSKTDSMVQKKGKSLIHMSVFKLKKKVTHGKPGICCKCKLTIYPIHS